MILHSRLTPVLHLHSTFVFTEIQKSVPAATQSEHFKGVVVVAVWVSHLAPMYPFQKEKWRNVRNTDYDVFSISWKVEQRRYKNCYKRTKALGAFTVIMQVVQMFVFTCYITIAWGKVLTSLAFTGKDTITGGAVLGPSCIAIAAFQCCWCCCDCRWVCRCSKNLTFFSGVFWGQLYLAF